MIMTRPIFASAVLVVIVFTVLASASGRTPSTSASTTAASGPVQDQFEPHPSQAAANVQVGFWRPSTFDSPYADQSGLVAAQVKAVYDKLRGISDVFREAPVLQSHVGFEVLLQHTAASPGMKDGATPRLPTSSVSVRLFTYIQMCATCPIQPEVESSGGIALHINDLDLFYDSWQQPFQRDEAGAMYLAPMEVGKLAGFLIYRGPGKHPKILLTNGNTRPIWVPVSQERYITSRITGLQNRLAKIKPPSDQTARRELAALEAELAGLSAADRAATAYVGFGNSERASGLGSASERGARAIVVTNTAYFDRTGPPTSFQMAVVETYPPDLLMQTPTAFTARMVVEVLKTADWKQIAGLIR